MKIIGLTGSIGMGKSVAAKMLRALGVPVFDSDACVHGLLAAGGAAVHPIAQRFPESFDSSTQSIQRTALGRIVFSNPAARKDLEDIVHPLVWAAQRHFLNHARRAGHTCAALDIPLLYETGSHRKCDAVFCVTAPHFMQRQRVLSRTGMTEEKFRAILDGQMPDAQKQKLADYIIPTGLGRAHTLQHLKKALLSVQRSSS